MNVRLNIVSIGVCIAAVASAPAVSAATLDGFDITAINSKLTTTYPGASTFTNSATFAGYSGSVTTPIATITGGVLNAGTNPDSGINGSILDYVASMPSSPEVVTFTADQTYFGFLWGSVDADNTVTFSGGALASPVSFTGADLNAAVGLQYYSAPGSFVNFTSAVGAFNTVTFSGNNNPFETANFAAVPEPASWAMMLVGIGAIGFAMRRRANVTVSHA